MRAAILSLVAVVSFGAPWAQVRAMPPAPHQVEVTVPASAITMVRQRCGQGMKRSSASQDKQGAWHGPCVPKHAAGVGGSGNIANQGDVANQLNAQEAARTAGGAR